MDSPATIFDLLQVGKDDHVAISGLDRPDLDYRGLRKLVAKIAATLNARGIYRGDRVAIVLPNGPEMATSFIAVSACATTAPLNPTYKRDEFDFYLSDLSAKALIVEKGSESPSVGVARDLGITVLEIESTAADPVGVFSIVGDPGD